MLQWTRLLYATSISLPHSHRQSHFLSPFDVFSLIFSLQHAENPTPTLQQRHGWGCYNLFFRFFALAGQKQADDHTQACPLYTYDAVDEKRGVDSGGLRIIKHKGW